MFCHCYKGTRTYGERSIGLLSLFLRVLAADLEIHQIFVTDCRTHCDSPAMAVVRRTDLVSGSQLYICSGINRLRRTRTSSRGDRPHRGEKRMTTG